ncbi:hypothetical protein LRR81_10180 [Metabacillus sp. GX 13764]|uniref:glycoside hydrolase family 38 N-terminal domain-containing protein n=1 Tax=Metabacillus kandeliae TaxID=2900151 RepID=UPI001E603F81|nr:glycoside hydrolase family 38 C-terminal domain-containing protein [Metabacillus kandeliae]MCD7034608.1 hypothetical protein [Metabacillus kandeliae]
MKSIKEVHILNHTHWDREWYETFEEFRYKLRNGLRYVQELLEKGSIQHFFLDGQTIILEDYEEIVSKEEFEKLVSFMKMGKVESGPWYLLADEFLVSGESLLKNLEIGIKKAAELGSLSPVGYLPDTFGHASQMPQILKGYGIEQALVWRGAVSSSFENTWEGPDGRRVLTLVLPLADGYYQTFLKHGDYIEKTKAYLTAKAPYLENGHALIMNGADHTFTAHDLNSRIQKLKEEMPELKFQESLLSAYIKEFQGKEPASMIKGEQRDPSKIFILPGVLSTRSYLKQQNQLCEDEALGVMEALNVWSNGGTDSEEWMQYIWKLILKNQPHDSICGCSIDEVHNEMETRTEKVLKGIQQFAADTLNSSYPFDYLNDAGGNPYLYMVNNHPFEGIYPVEAVIRIPAEKDLGSIKLFHNGEELFIDIMKRDVREEFLRHILAEPHYAEYAIYSVKFMLPFNGAEIKRAEIRSVKEQAELLAASNENKIENEFYLAEWGKNGLVITDKETGEVYEDQHILVSSLDAGDTYNYSPPVNDRLSKAVLTKTGAVYKGQTVQSAELFYEMELPASLNEDRSGPSEAFTINKIKTVVSLHAGERLITFRTAVENTARDQKLRVGFAAGNADSSFADTAFDLIQRETIREKVFDAAKNKEAVMNQYPSYSTVLANSHQLIHRGMQEAEIDRIDGKDYALLTMLRSVGWLSRRDLRTRGNGAGPGFETPGAQCLGTYEFHYALVLGERHHSLNNGKHLRSRVLTQQSSVKKAEQQLFRILQGETAFSSFQQKEEDTFQIRLFNPKEEEAEAKLAFGFQPAAVEEVNFSGNVLQKHPASATLCVTLKGKEIKTIQVKRNGRGNEGEEA